MDLVGLWERVPSLLDLCMDDEQSQLTALRLVSKEASRVALLALRYYTLTLSEERQGGHVNGSVARLLRQTHLQELTVILPLSGQWQKRECV